MTNVDSFTRLTGLSPADEIAPLHSGDTWLYNLGGKPGEPAWLESANAYNEIGSLHVLHTKATHVAAIRAGRQIFFTERLQLTNPSIPASKILKGNLVGERVKYPSTKNFVSAFRIAKALGAEPIRIMEGFAFPEPLDRVILRRNSNYLIESGYNIRKMTNRRLGTIKYSPNAICTYETLIKKHGFNKTDGTKSALLEARPEILWTPLGSLDQTFHGLHALFNDNADKVVAKCSGIVTFQTETLKARIANLQTVLKTIGHCVTAHEVGVARPVALCYGVERTAANILIAGSVRDRSHAPKEVGDLLVESPADALFSLSQGMGANDSLPYRRNTIRKFKAVTNEQERRETVDQVLRQPPFRAQVGYAALMAYDLYYGTQYAHAA